MADDEKECAWKMRLVLSRANLIVIQVEICKNSALKNVEKF